MKKYKVFIILLIVTIIYLTVNVSSAFVINHTDDIITAYKNNNLVRLHVIANSNSPRDQYIKREVRNRVIAKMSDYKDNDIKCYLQEGNDILTKQVESYVNRLLQEENIDYSAEVCLGNYNFPMRSYGNLTLPEGKYRAVRVVLGNGKGSNWWCVLLPPLCIASDDNNVNISKNSNIKFKLKIAEILNDRGYNFASLKDHIPTVKPEKVIDLPNTYIY